MLKKFITGPSSSSQEDARLVKILKKKGKEGEKAFHKLRMRHKDSLKSYILNKIGHNSIADDVIAETFIKVYYKIDLYSDEKGCFSTWLYRIANNVLIDYSRSKGNRIRFCLSLDETFDDSDEPRIQISSYFPSPYETLEDTELKKVLYAALEYAFDKASNRESYKLKKKTVILFKDIVYKRFVLEMKYEEIALELGMPVGTVKVTVFRAREFLTKYINKRLNK